MSKMATREAYGKALAELVTQHNDVIVLDADLSKSTKTADAKAVRAERHFNMGIQEANMMGVAAGMAANGFVVYASSFAMFAAGRAFEPIRNSICYPKLNVKVCATHAGISVGEDGASHQAIEDIALMRSIPNMQVFQPCDEVETKQIIEAVRTLAGPCYVRLGRVGVESVYDETYQFQVGKGHVLRKGSKVAIIATGLGVQESLKACDLVQEQLQPTVVNMATIKPIDKVLIEELAKTHDVIVTVEEHNVMGGLGSAVAEVLTQTCPIKQVFIGVEDTFGESGTPSALLAKYGLDANAISKRLLELV